MYIGLQRGSVLILPPERSLFAMPVDIIQVFVSSTSLDLEPERKAVESALQGLGETKFVGMEYFGSRGERTQRASLDEVNRSRVYVGIFAGGYGSGITEDEYRRARQLELPCFIYFKRETDISAEWLESVAEKAARLAALKGELRRQHTINEFTSPEDLACKVTADLHRWLFDEYLTSRLTQAAQGALPHNQAQALLDAIIDPNALSQSLRTQLQERCLVIGRGERDIAIGGNASESNIITGDRNVVTEKTQIRGDVVRRDKITIINQPRPDPAKKFSALTAIPVGVLGIVLVVFLFYWWGTSQRSIYRLRVTVTDVQGTPVEDAKVWSSVGGEPKKVAGGLQFDIPAANKPLDGKLTIFASKEDAFLTGETGLTLSNDYNPAVIVNLKRDDSGKVRGQVVDGKNHAVTGARVFVVGYQAEFVLTKDGGNFELAAHAALNQQVMLHAEKARYSVNLWHPAGDTPAVLVLER
jgi:hypothetical protein